MNRIHFFAVPKPWIPEFSAIQRSAVSSWKQLNPASITLLGSEEGTREICQEHDLIHLAEIETNEWGTPLVSSVFSAIRSATNETDIACYVNADIIFDTSFATTITAVVSKMTEQGHREWLAVGKRTDVDLVAHDTKNGGEFFSVEDAYQLADERGVDHGWEGIDYFVFPAHTFRFVYPFALGKFVWDQWLVGNAFRRGIPTIDCSREILAIHLNSPWYREGRVTTNRQAIHDSAEGQRNRSFDYYQKTILTGTTHFTSHSSSMVTLLEKTFDE